MLLPSGDHSEQISADGENVKRVGVFRAMSSSQISLDFTCESALENTIRLRSGERQGSAYRPGTPSAVDCLAVLSNITNWTSALSPLRYARVPSVDTENDT